MLIPSKHVSALVLAGILSWGGGLLPRPVAAAPGRATAAPAIAQTPRNYPASLQRLLVIQIVRRDLSGRTGISLNRIRVISAEQRTWPDRCLGLPRPNELCAQVLTPGWRVQLSDGRNQWTYHTDARGQNFRLANAGNADQTQLPRLIANAVLQEVSRQTGRPRADFRILEAEQRTWPDGCLGLARPQEFCTQAQVPGWRIIVTDGRRQWIYRTGSTSVPLQIRLEGTTQAGTGSLQPTRIPTRELPAPLPTNAIFRLISSGGFTGRNEQTILLDDGHILQTQLHSNGTTTQIRVIRRLSRQQVQQFKQLLERQNFSDFDRLSYSAPRGAADYITVTLSSDRGVVRYADIVKDQLPEALQRVIESWQQLSN
jgi:hypothetical protein